MDKCCGKDLKKSSVGTWKEDGKTIKTVTQYCSTCTKHSTQVKVEKDK